MKSSTDIEASPLFIDTWGWVVLADAGDPDHDDVVRLRRQSIERGSTLVTTDYGLDELITRLFASTHFAAARLVAAIMPRR